MAQQELDMAKTFTPMYSSGLIATCRADAAALLAGAEALERQERDLDAIKAADAALTEAMETISDLRGRLEVAKAALLKVRDHARPTHREDAYEVCYDWCPLCAVTAALARLEGE
jgi:hypothetical protein